MFYLDFGDDLFFRSVDVATIYDANNVRICTLSERHSPIWVEEANHALVVTVHVPEQSFVDRSRQP